MIGFGLYNPFPFTLGGGESTIEQEHLAILDALSPGWDTREDTELWCEAYADAVAVSLVWVANERLANQAIPERMLEALPVWEGAMGLRPTLSDTDVERRKRVAAKLRGLAGNALGDIDAACSAALGANYENLVVTATADQIAYWPGVNPGPPGFEWSSNRARIGVKMNTDGLNQQAFDDKRVAVAEILDALLPSWMTFAIGEGDDFTVGLSLIGQTFL